MILNDFNVFYTNRQIVVNDDIYIMYSTIYILTGKKLSVKLNVNKKDELKVNTIVVYL